MNANNGSRYENCSAHRSPSSPPYPREKGQPNTTNNTPNYPTEPSRPTGTQQVRRQSPAVATIQRIFQPRQQYQPPQLVFYIHISARNLSRRSNHFNSLTCLIKKPSPSSIVCAAQTSASLAVLSTLARDILLHENKRLVVAAIGSSLKGSRAT